MKFQETFRMQVTVMGFAAALLLAGSASAQEIENTRWDDGPNVAPFSQPAPTSAANDLNSAKAAPATLNTAASVAKPIAMQESVVSQGRLAEGSVIAFLLIFVALVALYRRADARRAHRNLEARVGQPNRRAAHS
jgi:hypothetical protein